jgi:signal transduction histidine kinase
LSSGIFSAAIADRDLVGALTVLAERSTAHSGNDVRFRYVSSRPLVLKESQASALFRIAQEATTNALRHSEAQGVEITLGSDAAGVLLTVEDNGIGCPPDAEQRGGSGLRIMRFRAHAVGAQFKILAVRAGGTRIECSLPLPVC